MRAGRSQGECETVLGKVSHDTRLRAYGAAVVLMKEKAPAYWRRTTIRMLFPAERPYFKEG